MFITLYHFDLHTTLLSLVPLAIVVFILLSFVSDFQKVGIRIQSMILENFVCVPDW